MPTKFRLKQGQKRHRHGDEVITPGGTVTIDDNRVAAFESAFGDKFERADKLAEPPKGADKPADKGDGKK